MTPQYVKCNGQLCTPPYRTVLSYDKLPRNTTLTQHTKKYLGFKVQGRKSFETEDFPNV